MFRHRVEGLAQLSQLVPEGHVDPMGEIPLGEGPGPGHHLLDGVGDPLPDKEGQNQDDNEGAGKDHRDPSEGEDLQGGAGCRHKDQNGPETGMGGLERRDIFPPLGSGQGLPVLFPSQRPADDILI